jgi:hypothetical protein
MDLSQDRLQNEYIHTYIHTYIHRLVREYPQSTYENCNSNRKCIRASVFYIVSPLSSILTPVMNKLLCALRKKIIWLSGHHIQVPSLLGCWWTGSFLKHLWLNWRGGSQKGLSQSCVEHAVTQTAVTRGFQQFRQQCMDRLGHARVKHFWQLSVIFSSNFWIWFITHSHYTVVPLSW